MASAVTAIKTMAETLMIASWLLTPLNSKSSRSTNWANNATRLAESTPPISSS